MFYENKGLSLTVGHGHNIAIDAHLHSHIELVYMFEGSTKVVVDSIEHTLSKGDALIVFPNQIHQYQRVGYEDYFITIFPVDICPEFQKIFMQRVPTDPIIRNACSNAKIPQFAKEMMGLVGCMEGTYNKVKIKGYLLLLLSELFNMMEFVDAKATDVDIIKAILSYCTENYKKDINLDTISAKLHISKYYISHLFKQKLHISFTSYISSLRISEACRLLADVTSSITHISYNVGFNTIRSFNRDFLKYTGMTPKQYRKSIPAKLPAIHKNL